MPLTKISQTKSFAGTQSIYTHTSKTTGCTMRFGIYLPPQAEHSPVPALYWLSGLTCTEENFIIKAGSQRIAAELGIAIITPDTSPRGLGIPGEDTSYDFGTGAGFYVDATVEPWATGYRMYSYITAELPELVATHFPVDTKRIGISGHSMGGHGALTIALKNPDYFKSVSAFSPICSPIVCPWGEKALRAYLGDNKTEWKNYDASALMQSRGWKGPAILIDQGTHDQFLTEQLKPELFEAACKTANVELKLRRQEGYDHSYFFIATFIEDHLRFHAENLG
jgi:S-formylglutathione hydrolase